MKATIFYLLVLVSIANGHISGGGYTGGCGYGLPPPPPPPAFPPPGPCGPRPFFPPQPPIASPCQPRPFYPPPPPPPSPYPAYGNPCQIPYGPQLQPHPSPHLPPLLQPPRVYPEIPPEEYLRLSNEQKLIKETFIKKNLPDPFEDAKRQPPIIPEKYYPEPRPLPIPSQGMGCGGGYYPDFYQQQQQQQQQYRPYLPYGQYYRPHVPYHPPPPPLPPTPPPMLQNCCTRCGCRSKAFGQKTANSTEELENVVENIDKKEGLECNNEKLKQIMEKSFKMSLKSAKLAIHEEAETSFGHSIQVICSEHDFEYTIRSSIFCQAELEKGICYAFKTG